jgi:hypothetical protein
MIPQPPIPEPLWKTVPPEAQAAILTVLDSLTGRIAELERRISDLGARLKLNSTKAHPGFRGGNTSAASTGIRSTFWTDYNHPLLKPPI